MPILTRDATLFLPMNFRNHSSRTAGFFHPRLVHFRSQYEQTPGLVRADWRDPKLSLRQKAVRIVLYKVRRRRPSPLGLSKLPFEVLDMIFRELCGREILAVLLVCGEWETVSRPVFAGQHLQRSLFWLTGSDLKRLESLARRFEPHIGTVYISTDHFTLHGLRKVWRRYTQHRDYLHRLTAAVEKYGADALLERADPTEEDAEMQTLLVGYVAGPLRKGGQYGNEYFRHAYRQHRPLSPWRTLRLRSFLWYFLCSIISQIWMRATGQDRRRLARIAEMMPRGTLQAVRVSHAAEKLYTNERAFGRASPGFSNELALLCGERDVLFDREYKEYVREIVAEAMEGKGP